MEADHASLKAGSRGLKGLLAYLGPTPNPGLLQNLDRRDARFPDSAFLRSRDLAGNGRSVGPLTRDGGAIVTQLSRVAFIGNSLPRRCGIATFTTDLQQAVAASSPQVETSIVAMTDHGHAYDYPPVVRFQINDDKIEDYVRAADFLNAGQFEIVSSPA